MTWKQFLTPAAFCSIPVLIIGICKGDSIDAIVAVVGIFLYYIFFAGFLRIFYDIYNAA